MLSSIHPLGERSRNNRFGVTAAAFISGAVLGGAVVGAILAVPASVLATVVPDGVGVALVALAAIAAIVADRRGAKPPIGLHRQVDERWLDTYRGWVYGAGFGVQLGAGIATYITTHLTYVVFLAAVLSGSPASSVAIVATFGLTRGLVILSASTITTPTALRRFFTRLAATARPAARAAEATVGAATLAAVALVVLQ